MRPPERMPTKPQAVRFQEQAGRHGNGLRDKDRSGVAQAGCCAQVCTPLGCHCVLEMPVCP